MNALRVFAKKCVGCELCGIVCSITHGDQVRRSGMRIRIKHRYPQLPTPPFEPMVCRNCESPKCVQVCPKEAILQEKGRKQIQIIESKCDGCAKCAEACPFQGIWVDPLRKVAIKCDLCNGDPQCANYCNFRAIRSPFEIP